MGLITSNGVTTKTCIDGFSRLDCSNPIVLEAYNPAAPDPFSQAATVMPGQPGGCNDVYSSLQISPGIASLKPSQTQLFTASGGTPPYVFSLIAGQGQISSTGTYTAPSASSLETVRVTDSWNQTQDATFIVGPAKKVTWIGAVDAQWTTPGNWQGGSPPGPSDLAVFDQSCQNFCSPVIDSNIDVGGIQLTPSYAGVITQGPGVSVTVESLGYSQYGGEFLGSDGSITAIEGGFNINSGIFRSTSGPLTFRGNIGVFPVTQFRVSNLALFDHHLGSVVLGTGGSGDPVVNLDLGGASLNNLKFNLGGNPNTVTVIDSFSVLGSLTINDYDAWINGGTIIAYGDVANTGSSSSGHSGGSTNIVLAGSNGQRIIGIVNNFFPSLTIAGQSNEAVSLEGTIEISSNWTYTSGNVQAGSSLVEFGDAEEIITPGSMSFNSVHIKNHGSDGGVTIVGTMHIGGDLSVDVYSGGGPFLSGGTAEVAGNLSVVDAPGGSTLSFVMTGPGANSYTNSHAGVMPKGEFVVNKNIGGSVTFLSPMILSDTGDSFTVMSGTVDLNSRALNINGAFSVLNGAIFDCDGGCGIGTSCNQGLDLQCLSFSNSGTIKP